MKRIAIILVAVTSFTGAAYGHGNRDCSRQHNQYSAFTRSYDGPANYGYGGPAIYDYGRLMYTAGSNCNLQRPGKGGGWYC